MIHIIPYRTLKRKLPEQKQERTEQYENSAIAYAIDKYNLKVNIW